MIVGFVLIAVFAGSIAFAIALFFLASFWLAFGAYGLVGFATLILLAITLMARGDSRRSLDAGTEYEFRWPTPQPSPIHVDPPTKTSMKILAVDDDPFILELIPMLASKAGFPDVTAVASGEHALWILENSDIHFDCFLLDISMPSMDGIELCGRVRQMPHYATTPIVMLTAMRDVKNMGNAYRAGATDYVTKPFDIEELGIRLRLAQGPTLAGPAHRYNQEIPAVAVSNQRFDLPKGVEGLVEHTALESYLTQFPRRDVSSVQVYAVALEGLDMIQTRKDVFQTKKSHLEMVTLLKETSLAVADFFGRDQLLMAYTDTATLLVVTHSMDLLSGVSLEAKIEIWLSDKRYDLSVAVGGSIPLQGSKAKRAKLTIDRALTLADLRAYEKKVVPYVRAQSH